MCIRKLLIAAIGTLLAIVTYGANPKWTLKSSNTVNNGWEDSSCVWVDKENVEHTWDSSSAIDYIVPAGFDLRTRYDNNNSGATRTFSSNPATTLTFVGAATESGRGRFLIKSKTVIVPNLIAGDWTLICFGNYYGDTYANQELRGSMVVDTKAAPAKIRAHANNNSVQTVSAKISGTGSLLFFPENRNSQKAGKIVLSGDNSDYLGNIIVASDNQSTMTLSVSSSANLGGNPTAFAQRGVELGSKATLEVTGDVTLGANRGLYISDDSTLSVSSGKTFFVPGKISFASGKKLTKKGAGTFSVANWDDGMIVLSEGNLNLEETVTVENGEFSAAAIGELKASSGFQVLLRIKGDGSQLTYNSSYDLITSKAALPEGFADVVNVVFDEGAVTLPAGAVASYSVVDGTKFVMTVGNYSGNPIWIGGGSDSKFSTSANWLGGVKPEANSSVPLIFAATQGGIIENDIEGIAPSSITFRSGCADLVIEGNGLNIPEGGAIVNKSSTMPEFKAAVTFGKNIDVTGEVKFSGGVVGQVPVNHKTYYGKYKLLAEEWTPPEGAIVPSGGEIRMENGTLLNAQGLSIQSGGAVYAKSLTRRYYGVVGSRSTQLYSNAGTLSVGEIRWEGSISSTSENASFFPVYSGSGKVILRTEKLVHKVLAGNGTKQAIVYLGNAGWENVFVIGEGGMTFEKPDGVETMYSQYQLQNDVTVTLAPTADWKLHQNLASNTRRGIYLTSGSTLNILTTDYDEPSTPRTITIDGLVLDGRNNKGVNIKGIGTVLYNYKGHTSAYGMMYDGSVTVADSATFAVNAECSLWDSSFSFNDTSTLKVAQSGSVSFSDKIVLASTATLAFNFTDSETAPTLAIPTTSSIPAKINVKLSADEGIWPSQEKTYKLTSTFNFSGKTVNLINPPKWVKSVDVLDGNLVLTVKSKGLALFIR
jgi:hypothetical protein